MCGRSSAGETERRSELKPRLQGGAAWAGKRACATSNTGTARSEKPRTSRVESHPGRSPRTKQRRRPRSHDERDRERATAPPASGACPFTTPKSRINHKIRSTSTWSVLSAGRAPRLGQRVCLNGNLSLLHLRSSRKLLGQQHCLHHRPMCAALLVVAVLAAALAALCAAGSLGHAAFLRRRQPESLVD